MKKLLFKYLDYIPQKQALEDLYFRNAMQKYCFLMT